MARKRAHKKRMTITQKYNRIAKGLLFFGVEQEEKKRATTKQLKALQKIYKQIRKSLQEAGEIDLPTIAQASKFITEQEKEAQSQQPEREPLPYAEEDYTEFIDTNRQIIDEFVSMIKNTFYELYSVNPVFIFNEKYQQKLLSQEHEITVLLSSTQGDSMLEQKIAEYLAKSKYYDEIRTVTYMRYDDIIDYFDSLIANFNALINNIAEEFIAPNTINFDNI